VRLTENRSHCRNPHDHSLRDKVIIATKFGWDIDQVTGEHRGGVNSRPAQIR
jgi:hypothetical protein